MITASSRNERPSTMEGMSTITPAGCVWGGLPCPLRNPPGVPWRSDQLRSTDAPLTPLQLCTASEALQSLLIRLDSWSWILACSTDPTKSFPTAHDTVIALRQPYTQHCKLPEVALSWLPHSCNSASAPPACFCLSSFRGGCQPEVSSDIQTL